MDEMHKRKIQKTGIATYTVSLPKSWIVRNSIQSGDTVSVFEENNQSLSVILHEKSSEVKEATIKLNEFKNETEVIRKFVSHYLNGVLKMTIHSDERISDAYMKKILSQVKKVIGFEIVEESESKIVLQDFFSSNYLSLTKIIRRMFQLSRLIIQETNKILDNEVKKLDNLQMWEEEVNKLYLLARRQINFAFHNSIILNQLNLDVKDCQDFLILIESIEKMCDSFVAIAKGCRNVDIIPLELKDQFGKKYEDLLETYKMAFESVFKKDFDLSNQAISKCELIKSTQINLENSNLSEKNKINLYIILTELHLKANFIKDIAEIGLDRC